MGIARMLKATVIGYGPAMEDVLDVVQRSGSLEVKMQPFELETADVGPEGPERLEVDEQLADAIFVREFLGRYHTVETPLSAFVTEKIHVTSRSLFDMRYTPRMNTVYHECASIADRIAAAGREVERLTALVADLEPWQELRLEIARWQATERTLLVAGTVPAASGSQIRQSLREQVSEVTVQELGPTGDRQAWLVVAIADRLDDVRSVLATADFAEVSFPGLRDYPAEETATALDHIAALRHDVVRLAERATELSTTHYAESVALVQALESRREAVIVREDVGCTQRAFVVTGWIPEKRSESLRSALETCSDAVDVTLRAPEDDENPPVQLDNPGWLKPFELLTELYGLPTYRAIDPTPLHAPFFLLFFALCIGDLGYGPILILGAWLIKHRLDVTAGVKRFMDLLMIGGAASMVVGVLLGSYLALPIESLPQVLQNLQVLDPLEDIQWFLGIALVIGALQVFFGVIVAIYECVRRGDVESAIFDHFSILFLFGALAVTAVAGMMGNSALVRASLVIGIVGAMIMRGRAVQAATSVENASAVDRAVGIGWSVVLLAGVIGSALTGSLTLMWIVLGVSAAGLAFSPAIRRGTVGVLFGAYSVYGLTGFVGDILSYLRLPAIGLSGMLVGGVFNILTGLVWTAALPLFAKGGFSMVLGAIVAVLAVAVFSFGHLFNVVINLLGAFVHPMRLQFVEFFGKFYQAGGQPFAPFGFKTDGLVLDAGAPASKEE